MEVSKILSLERDEIEGCRSRWLDQGGAAQERLVVAVGEHREAAKKYGKGPSQTGEMQENGNLATKNPVKGQAALCQSSLVN